MAKMQLPGDFRELLRLFNEHQVEYLLIGGYAVGYHGHPRATGDMDLWVNPAADNAERIFKALTAFGFSPATISADLFVRPHRVVRMGVPPMRIELLTTASGVEFDVCYARCKRDTLSGVVVPIISLHDLRANKQACGRLKDLSDLENLPEQDVS